MSNKNISNKKLIVLGRTASEGDCRRIVAGCDDALICDFSEYYQINRDELLKRAKEGLHIELSAIFHKVQEDMRDKYLDFIADWPNKVLWRGKDFKELFAWKGISLWWFSEPARKVIGEYGEYSKICEIFTIRDIISSCGIDSVQLISCPKAFRPTLKKIFPKIRISHIGPAKECGLLKHLLRRIIVMFNAILIKFIFNDKSNRYGKDRIGIISFNLYNWIESNKVPVDRLYQGLVEDKSLGNVFDWIFVTSANMVDLIRKKKLKDTLGLFRRIRDHYGRSSLTFVENKIGFSQIVLRFVDCSAIIRYLLLARKKEFRDSLTIEGVNIFDIFHNAFVKSFVVNTFESQMLSECFYRLNRDVKHETYVTYAEFFPTGRAVIHGVKRADTKSRIVWHQHSMQTKGKTMFINRIGETNKSGSKNYVQSFPIADKYLMWGKQARSVVAPGFPESRIKLIGSYKYVDNFYAIASHKEESKGGKKKILIVPSNYRRDWLFLFNIIFNALKDAGNQYDVKVTKHPAVQKEMFINDLKRFKGGVDVVYRDSTSDALTEADIVIGGVTTVILDAILAGKFAIICKSPNDIYYGIDKDDFPENSQEVGIAFVCNHQELRKSLQDFSSSGVDELINKRRKLVDDILEYRGPLVKEKFWEEVRQY
ncbi:MAG: hypothetical protein NTZ10_02925 [Candidatus Saganbacteria bacterium]|nr:hypothetical protein [Candidatus Saganbacteria bacterium]